MVKAAPPKGHTPRRRDKPAQAELWNHSLVKQVIVVNESLILPAGKLAAQVAHAAVGAFLRADEQAQATWLQAGMPKVVLADGDEADLIAGRQSGGGRDWKTERRRERFRRPPSVMPVGLWWPQGHSRALGWDLRMRRRLTSLREIYGSCEVAVPRLRDGKL